MRISTRLRILCLNPTYLEEFLNILFKSDLAYYLILLHLLHPVSVQRVVRHLFIFRKCMFFKVLNQRILKKEFPYMICYQLFIALKKFANENAYFNTHYLLRKRTFVRFCNALIDRTLFQRTNR